MLKLLTKTKLERLKRDLMEQLPEYVEVDHKKELINKLNKIAAKRNDIQRNYDQSDLTEMEAALEAEPEPVKREVWKAIIKVLRRDINE